jgi:hypothetical protein
MMIYVLILLIWLALETMKPGKWKWHFWLIPAAVGLIMSPWVVRNYVVLDKIVLFESNFGENL